VPILRSLKIQIRLKQQARKLGVFPGELSLAHGLVGISAVLHSRLTPNTVGKPIGKRLRKRQISLSIPTGCPSALGGSITDWSYLLFCESLRTKILIWQKHRTQKNESRIFLRSMFLPLQGHSKKVGGVVDCPLVHAEKKFRPVLQIS
jgi:hypothetical protein